MSKQIKVLSIDGGGIYGIISAMVLEEIERLTGKAVSELFDLVAGTSTGGIIALGLTTPDASGKPRYSAEEMVRLYETKGDQIFSRTLLHEIIALGNLLDQKYDSFPIERTLRRYFGESKLSESLTKVLITAYNIEQRSAYFFKTRKAKRDEDYDFFLRDIARSTSAGPSYFEPAKIQNVAKSQTNVFVDGGVFANNPAMCAYAEVKAHFPQHEDIFILSIGTLGAQKPYRYEDARDWGAAKWITPVLQIMRDGVMETVDYQLRQIFTTTEHKDSLYERIQPMTEGDIPFDEPTEANIRLLKEYARKYIEENDTLLRTIAGQLLS